MLQVWLIHLTEDRIEVISNSSAAKPQLQTTTSVKRILKKETLLQLIEKWHDFYYRTIERDYTTLDKRQYTDTLAQISEHITELSGFLCSLLFGHRKIPLDTVGVNFEFFIDPSLSGIPFEILQSESGFIIETSSIERRLRFAKESNRYTDFLQKSSSSLKGLFLLDNITDALKETIEEENSNLIELIKKYLQNEFRVLRLKNIKKISVLQLLTRVDIFHYAGHSDKGSTVLPGGLDLKADIKLLNLNNLKLVFFNSCYSAGSETKNHLFAELFIDAGAQHFIGYNLQVKSDSSVIVAKEFYKNYFKKNNIEKSVFMLRQNLKKVLPAHDLTRFTICQ